MEQTIIRSTSRLFPPMIPLRHSGCIIRAPRETQPSLQLLIFTFIHHGHASAQHACFFLDLATANVWCLAFEQHYRNKWEERGYFWRRNITHCVERRTFPSWCGGSNRYERSASSVKLKKLINEGRDTIQFFFSLSSIITYSSCQNTSQETRE